MADIITEAFVVEYTDTVTLVAQQMTSRTNGKCRREDGIVGTRKDFDYVQKRSPNKRASRHADTIIVPAIHERRWVSPETYDDADLIDKPDQVKTLVDPTNAYTKAMGAGFGRMIDEVTMDAAIGTAVTGQAGAGTQALPSASKDTTAGAITLIKCSLAREFFDEGEHDEDSRFWAITAKVKTNLMEINEVKSSDYNTIKVLSQGKIDTWYGFTWVRMQSPILKLNAAADQRQTISWCWDCLLTGYGYDVVGSIDRRPDKNNSTQILYTAHVGAVRLRDDGVFMVECSEE